MIIVFSKVAINIKYGRQDHDGQIKKMNQDFGQLLLNEKKSMWFISVSLVSIGSWALFIQSGSIKINQK